MRRVSVLLALGFSLALLPFTSQVSAKATAQATTSTIKPDPIGFVQLGGPAASSYLNVVRSFAIYVDWSVLQPTANGPIAANNAIDAAIVRLRKVEQANPGIHLKLKVRVMAGIYEPSWVKNIDGPPVTVEDPQFTHTTGTLGRFWTEDFHKAYRGLMAQLAAKYDSVPELADVAMTRCMTITGEPFIRPWYDLTTVHNFFNAGYTVAADKTCQTEQVDDAALWKTTHSSLSFNGFIDVTSSGQRTLDMPFTVSVMSYCRKVLGPHCTLENNDMVAQPTSYYTTIYQDIASYGAPIAFQTNSLYSTSDMITIIKNCIHYKAQSVELTGGYQKVLTPTQLKNYLPQLQANA